MGRTTVISVTGTRDVCGSACPDFGLPGTGAVMQAVDKFGAIAKTVKYVGPVRVITNEATQFGAGVMTRLTLLHKL